METDVSEATVVRHKFDMGPEFPPVRSVRAGGSMVHFWIVLRLGAFPVWNAVFRSCSNA